MTTAESGLVVKVVYEAGFKGLAAGLCGLLDSASSTVKHGGGPILGLDKCDVIVVMGNTASVFEAVLKSDHRTPTLVLGPPADQEMMLNAVDRGAIGYLSNQSPMQTIIDSVASVSQGAAVLPAIMLGPLAKHSIEQVRREETLRKQLDELTPRQREVFQYAAKGLDKSEIAKALGISPETVRTHIYNLMSTLGLHSRNELIALAYDLRLEEVVA